jgi:hypothetical protein
MRHITCFVFVAIVFINGIKAQPKSGSISGLTENKVQESLQVELLLDSAQKLYNVDLKKSLVVAQDALSSSEESGYDKGIQNALAIMSRIQRRLGNFSVLSNTIFANYRLLKNERINRV